MDLKLENLTEEQKENVLKLAEQIKQEEKRVLYLKGHVASGISAGDRVKITAEYVAESNGYIFTRIGQSRQPKGYIGEVTCDDKEKGFWIDGEHLCPYYVLEKIEENWIVVWWTKKNPNKKLVFTKVYNSEKNAMMAAKSSLNSSEHGSLIKKINL